MSELQIIECVLGDTSQVIELGVQTSAKNILPRTVATLDANYSCKISAAGAIAINRAVSDKTVDSLYFRGWFTPTETTALGVGNHLMGMQITNNNLAPPLVKEKQWRLVIVAQAVS